MQVPHTTQPATAPAAPQELPVHTALRSLCEAVIPVWRRHLDTAQDHAELAVSEMLAAFAEIHPALSRQLQVQQQIPHALDVAGGGPATLSGFCAGRLLPLLPTLDAAGTSAVQECLDAIEGALERVGHITQAAEADALRQLQQAERMLVGLQYQDRISQMMALLAGDMQRLQDTLADPATDIQDVCSKAWLARLESGYAMEAQRHAHHDAGGPAEPHAPRPDAGTDFF